MSSKKKYNVVIIVLSILILALTACMVYLIHTNNLGKNANSNISNSLQEAQNEISSYKDSISQKNSELESYSNSIDEQNAIHESEKQDLNNKISELNKQIALKKKREAQAAAAAAAAANPAPAPVPATPAGSGEKTIYLTFDDGPSPNTPRILDILNRYGVKATFFVKNTAYNGYMQDIVNNGNVIALHTYTHNYQTIYTSDEAFYNDLQSISDLVFMQTGVRSNIMRFPGGSSNTVSKKYNEGIMTRLTQGVTERGYIYYDWNCSSGDASGDKVPKDTIVSSCKKVPSSSTVIVLLHDTGAKGTTVEALPEVIEFYQSCGYSFGVITQNTPPVHHRVNN